MTTTLQACLQFLALPEDQQREYLGSELGSPVGFKSPEVEILTCKPLLIMAVVIDSKPYSGEWFESLTAAQQEGLQELESVLTLMIELGVWDLFSFDATHRESAGPYLKVWGACRTLAKSLLEELGSQARQPELTFEYFLKHFTFPVQGDAFSEFVR